MRLFHIYLHRSIFRYLFESNHQKYLPTIALENGPIDLGLVWPEACLGYPKYSEVSKPIFYIYTVTHHQL